LLETGVLTQAQFDALNFGDLTAFWQSEVGVALRKVSPTCLNREMEFTARLTAGDLKQLPALGLGGALAADDFIVVQGQVDLAVLLPEEIWLLDFKTDAVEESATGRQGEGLRTAIGSVRLRVGENLWPARDPLLVTFSPGPQNRGIVKTKREIDTFPALTYPLPAKIEPLCPVPPCGIGDFYCREPSVRRCHRQPFRRRSNESGRFEGQ
jgi:hypothetical protein